MTVRQPYIGSGRVIEAGELVTRKQDFNAHAQGGGFRHDATMTDMNPVIGILGGLTVQQTLEQLTNMVTSSGTGFISIGDADGYGVGTYNINTVETPTFTDAFAAALTDTRLTNGGIILILAGTYAIDSTVTVPPGITVMGELEGTILNGVTIEQSMFKIERPASNLTIGGNLKEADVGINLGTVKFFNLTLVDNYGGAASSMTTVPMIECEISSNFICEQVKFIGRLNDGGIPGRAKTLEAIGYIAGGVDGTCLKLNHCYFDAMKIAGNFGPGNGDKDFLIMNGCRARTFGTESADISPEKNCFVAMSRCNATLTNNYHIGASESGNTTRWCYVVESASGGSDTRVVLTGNHGGPVLSNFGATLFYSIPNCNIRTVRSGNNWGNNVNNEWFVVIGNNNPDFDTYPGDFVGPTAIDDFLATSNYGLPTTCVVNPGEYKVTTSALSSSNIKFIGNPTSSTNYPVFNMDITLAGTDILSRKEFAVGRSIKSIRFRCDTGTTSSFHGITINHGNGMGVEVDDCIFHNTGLIVSEIWPVTIDGADTNSYVNLKNCTFIQTGSYGNQISMILPVADEVLVENCVFKGYGFVGGVGSISSPSYTHKTLNGNVTFRKCKMDMTGATITTNSPITTSDYQCYFWINVGDSSTEKAAKVKFEDCQIFANNTLSLNAQNIGAAVRSYLTASPIFDKFISIYAKECVFENCLFNGPNQTFTPSAGAVYAMPTLFVRPTQGFKFMNSRIIGGALPLQICGTAFGTELKRDSIIIENSEFYGSTVGETLVDVDVDLSTPSEAEIHKISINNNIFISRGLTANPYRARHTDATGSFYNAIGALQIYANFFDVTAFNNSFDVELHPIASGTYPTTINHYGAIVINNYDSISGTGALPSACNILNNVINIESTAVSATSTDSSSNIWVKTSILKVIGNTFFFDPDGTNLSFHGNLWINMLTGGAVPYADGIVSGNSFSRRAYNGFTGGDFLVGGYIYIHSDSARGMIVDNSFSDSTIDGSSTVLVLDNTTQPNKWFVSRNKNQTETLNITALNGKMALSSAAGLPILIGDYDTNPIVTTSGNNTSISYTKTATSKFYWKIPLFGLLPDNVKIIDVETTGTPTIAFDDSTFSFALVGLTPGTENGSPTLVFPAVSAVTSNITPANTSSADTYVNTATENLRIDLYCVDLQDASDNGAITFSPIAVTYRW